MGRAFAGRDDRIARGPGDEIGEDVDLLIERLRSGTLVVLVGSLVFVLVDLQLSRDTFPVLLAVKTLQCAILIGFLIALTRLRRMEALRWVGAGVTSAIYCTTIVSGLLRDELITSSFLIFVTAMATATFVPWGGRAQLLTAAVAALALMGSRVLRPEPLGREAVYRWLAIGIALSGSVLIAREQERRRREQQSAERQLANESLVSAALARAGEEMIGCASTPGILDRLCSLVAELLRCDQTSLILYDPGEDAYLAHSTYGRHDAEWRKVRVSPSAMYPLLAQFQTGGVVRVATEEMGNAPARTHYEQQGITNTLYVPLRRAGEVIGIITAHLRDPRQHFGRTEERIAVGVAHLASMALQNTRLLEELREANRIKSDFVSTMSHELRTPVSVILGYAEMLSEDPDGGDRDVILQRIRRSGLELLDMVEETLSLSRLEAGQDPPRLEPVELAALIGELIGEFEAMLPLDDVVLRRDGPERVVVESDRRKLRMILKNLIGNALKFTARGEVVVSCARDRDQVRFVVRDTGIGIASQHLPIIFDMFRQADSSDARTYSGAGLGLYIVRRLVTQLGGEIAVTSEVGRGSAFTVTLPDGARATSYPPSAPSPGVTP